MIKNVKKCYFRAPTSNGIPIDATRKIKLTSLLMIIYVKELLLQKIGA